MTKGRFALVLACASSLVAAATVSARVVAGNARTACYATFEGISPATGTTNRVECKDGDPCDADGAVNSSCRFEFSVCAYQSIDGCTAAPTTKFGGNASRLGLPVPAVGASAPTCAAPGGIDVQIKGRKPKGKRKVKLVAVTSARPKKANVVANLFCLKNTGDGGPTTPTCPNNPAGGPRELVYTQADTGTDLDTGMSGASHNFPVIAGASLHYCLTECNSADNPVCKANGPTGQGTANGATFGPPLPLFSAGVPVCVINKFRESSVRGTANVMTGEFEAKVDGADTPILLDSEVYSTTATQVCPKCANNRCDSGPNRGANCTEEGRVRVVNPVQNVDEVYRLSSQCPPGASQGSRTGTIPISLPVTSGTASIAGSKPCPGQQKDDQCGTFGAACTTNCAGQADVKGGINQWCCSDRDQTPCFPTAPNSGEPNHAIVRTGTPVPPTPLWETDKTTYPKTAENAKVVAPFCIGDSGETTINQVAGLPGPGAVTFNGRHEWLGNQ